MPQKSRSIFYGWWIVAGGFILFFFGIGLGINTVGIFIEEIVSSMGFTRGGFSLFFTIAAVSMMFAAIVIGKLIEKFNIKIIMGICTFLFALGFGLYSQCRTLTEFYLTSVLMGVGSAGVHIIPVTTMVNNWFVKKRGLATGIVFAGTGIGGLVLNPFVTWLIETNYLHKQYGWESAFIICGVLAGAICLPIVFFIMKKTPQEMGLLPDGNDGSANDGGAQISGDTVKEAVKTPEFWLVAAMALLFSLLNMGINQHLFSYFKAEVGFTASAASMIVGGYLGMTVFGKIAIGQITDRTSLSFGISMFIAIIIAGVVILINAKYLWIAVLFVVVFGFGNVIQTVVPPLVTAECFGLLQYGLIFGIISVFMTIGSGIGTPLSGFIYDRMGSYKPAFMLYIALLVLSLLIALMALKRARYKR